MAFEYDVLSMSLVSVSIRSLIAFMLCLSVLGLMRPAGAILNVLPNQMFQYNFVRTNISGNDTDLIAQLPGQTFWMNMTVTAVSGDLLTVQAFSYNLTVVSTSSTISINYITGETTPVGGQRFFVPGNLGAGDEVHFAYPENQTYKLNETSWQNYLGIMMQTNRLSYGYFEANSSYYGVVANVSNSWDFYWDKVTGVLDEFNSTATISRTAANGDLLLLVQNTDFRILWANPMIPEFESPFVGLLALLVVVVVVFASKPSGRFDPAKSLLQNPQTFS
jgi:hypothetical protein